MGPLFKYQLKNIEYRLQIGLIMHKMLGTVRRSSVVRGLPLAGVVVHDQTPR